MSAENNIKPKGGFSGQASPWVASPKMSAAEAVRMHMEAERQQAAAASRKTPSSEDIASAAISRGMKNSMARRIRIAEMLIAGGSYDDIQGELRCSSALVAEISRSLKAKNLL